jgi:hypothetical protein
MQAFFGKNINNVVTSLTTRTALRHNRPFHAPSETDSHAGIIVELFTGKKS